LPERLGQVELLDLLPDTGRLGQVNLAVVEKRMKEGADDGENLWLLGSDHNSQQLSVEISSRVVGGDQALELLNPFLVVEELSSGGDMISQV
jgi:hypothetical protein